MSDEINDPNLLACTLKKSLHVTWKIFNIVLLLMLFVVACYLMYILAVLVVTLVMMIPWWAYTLISIPVAVIGYSFCWCVARDITYEEWHDEGVNNSIMWAAVIYGCIAMTSLLCTLAAPDALVVAMHGYAGVIFGVVVVFVTALATLVSIAEYETIPSSLNENPVFFTMRFIPAAILHHNNKK